MGEDEPVSFIASFPNIQTAIRVAGDGGARILLDIPETELPAIVRLLLLRGQTIRVTVEAERHGGEQPKTAMGKWHRE